MTFCCQLSQVFSYSGTLSVRPPGGTLLLRRLQVLFYIYTEKCTKQAVLHAARELGPQLIAGHVNHTFTVEEALSLAREFRGFGAHIEVITADAFGAKQLETTPELAFALLREGLVDVISTDYSGGYHDPILLVLQKAIEEGITGISHITSYILTRLRR